MATLHLKKAEIPTCHTPIFYCEICRKYQPKKKRNRNFSNTPTLIRTLLIRADQLLRVTLQKDCPVEDAYQAFGMMEELVDEADRLFCEYYYDLIPEGQRRKSFEELTGKHSIAAEKALAAKVGK